MKVCAPRCNNIQGNPSYKLDTQVAPIHWSDKTVKIGYQGRYIQLTITKLQSQVRLVYDTPVYPHGNGPPAITDQITDQNTPYCDELRDAVSNDIRLLAVIRCSGKE